MQTLARGPGNHRLPGVASHAAWAGSSLNPRPGLGRILVSSKGSLSAGCSLVLASSSRWPQSRARLRAQEGQPTQDTATRPLKSHHGEGTRALAHSPPCTQSHCCCGVGAQRRRPGGDSSPSLPWPASPCQGPAPEAAVGGLATGDRHSDPELGWGLLPSPRERLDLSDSRSHKSKGWRFTGSGAELTVHRGSPMLAPF